MSTPSTRLRPDAHAAYTLHLTLHARRRRRGYRSGRRRRRRRLRHAEPLPPADPGAEALAAKLGAHDAVDDHVGGRVEDEEEVAHDVGDEVADGDWVLAVPLALGVLPDVGDLVEGQQDAGKVAHLQDAMPPSELVCCENGKTNL